MQRCSSLYVSVAFKSSCTHKKLYTQEAGPTGSPGDNVSDFQELHSRAGREEGAYGQRSEVREPVVLRYPLPYPHDSPPLPLVPQQPAELQYGNPYCEQNTRGAY